MERSFQPKFQIPQGAIVNPYGINTQGMLTWKNKKNGFFVAAVHYTADPLKRSQEWFENATKDLRQDQIEREYEIDFESRAGQRAFGYLLDNPGRWQIPDMDLYKIPKHWRIIASLDYGTLNPTAIYFYAIDEFRRFYTIFEFYKPSNVREIAAVLKGIHPDYKHPLWRRCERVVVDGAIFNKTQERDSGEGHNSVGSLLEEQGIYTMERATKDRIAGLERVHDMLKSANPEEKPNLFFCKRCTAMWKELTELVYDELPPHLLLNKNKKEDVVAKNDHCFVAGTMISTPAGETPIEKLKKGDLVLTRGGAKPVLAAGPTEIAQTYTLKFTNGSELTCTGNHPIWTENKGWARADELSYEDICVTNQLKKKKLNLTQRKRAGSNAVRILERCPAEIAQVYNMTVEDRHEYFAEGILVSNSYDSLRYGLMAIQAPSDKPPAPKPGDGTLGAVEKEMDLSDDEEDPDFF